MHLGYLFIFSVVMILVGCLGIMLMFMVDENVKATRAMFLAMGIGISITVFNLITFPPQASQAKLIACILGMVAVAGFVFNKRNHALIAKFMISSSIILGLTQLILFH